jgi:hypothetical protein
LRRPFGRWKVRAGCRHRRPRPASKRSPVRVLLWLLSLRTLVSLRTLARAERLLMLPIVVRTRGKAGMTVT